MLKNINYREIENLCVKCREELKKNGKACPFLSFDNEPCPELVLVNKVFGVLTATIAKKYEKGRRR